VEHQAKLQLTHDIQGTIALLGLESVNGDKNSLPTKSGRVGRHSEMVGTPEQDEKYANQVQDFTFGDGHAAVLREHGMNLRDGPVVPKAPVPNLHNDFQRKAAAPDGQTARLLRHIDPLRLGTTGIGTPVRHIHNPFTPMEKDKMFLPHLIPALQHVPTMRARGLFWSIVTFANLAIIFRSSHSSPLARS
jgi:hypothetical protein